MKYLIITKIKGEASDYQQKLVNEIADKFNVKGAIKRKSPTHVTLKYSFETENTKKVEECIRTISNKYKKFKYKLKGINHFDNKTIFIDVIPTQTMNNLYKELLYLFETKTNIEFKEFDKTTHFHSTLAQEDIVDKYDDIMTYLENENPEFDVTFDNITILVAKQGIWEECKSFELI